VDNLAADYDVFLSGVGGQGLVLLSNVMGTACASSGIRALTGEQHGLSQRSGSINVHFRISGSRRSPLIPIGGADVLLALEALEALRYVEYLQPGGVVLMNTRIQHPVSETARHVKDRVARYMSAGDVEEKLREVTDKILAIDALALANDAGNPMAENIVMLGALSSLQDFPVSERAVLDSISATVPKKAVDVNLRAFELGKREARSRLCDVVKCRE